MQRNFAKKVLFGVVALVIFVSPLFVLIPPAGAQNSTGSADNFGLDSAAAAAGVKGKAGSPQAAQQIIGQFIGIALSFVGVIFLILVIWGGIKWMTAQGEEEKISSAKKIISAAVVGLILVFAAYLITSFVLKQLGSSFGVGQ